MTNDNNTPAKPSCSEFPLPSQTELMRILNEQRVILDNAGVGICFIQQRRIQRCNQRFAEIYGYGSPDLLIHTSSEQLYPDNLSFRKLGVQAYPILARGLRFNTEIQMRRRSGELFWCRLAGKMINPAIPEEGSIWIVDDIDQQRRTADYLEQLTRQQQLILDHAMVGIVFLRDRHVTRCNQRFAELLGYTPEELTNVCSQAWYADKDAWEVAGERYNTVLSSGQAFEAEIELVRKDGTRFWCDARSKAIDAQDLSKGIIWIIMDISERKATEADLIAAHQQLEQRVEERTRELELVVTNLHREIEERKVAEERIRHLAQHDSLTGLPNRGLFEARLDEQIMLASATSPPRGLAVLFVDLDRFKHINDSLGHHEGDMLLRSLSERLRLAIGNQIMLARIGGDEFVIMLTDITPRIRIEQVIKRIQAALVPVFRVGLHEFRVSSSIGISIYPDDGHTPQVLIQRADTAMYRAKANGRNQYHFYNHRLDREQSERVELENALFHALRHNEFELHYQPQVEIPSGKIIGVEALIRWNRPGHGMVSPANFIPMAEETGLITELGGWVLEQACSQLQQWHDDGISLRVSVNLSAPQLDDPGFCNQVSRCLNRHQLDPSQLELELTESIIMKHVDQTIHLLEQLSNMGVHLSVDDFGTGYSSLSYLKRFPLNKLKIDQSFVRDICIDPDDAIICRTIISMADNLKLTVIAEGVEDAEQLAMLAKFGCHQYQGYFFSRPVPADQIPGLVADSLSKQPTGASNYQI